MLATLIEFNAGFLQDFRKTYFFSFDVFGELRGSATRSLDTEAGIALGQFRRAQ